MSTMKSVRDWPGRNLIGQDQEELGTIRQVFGDRQTGEPSFVSVRTGWFGMRASLVPITDAALKGNDVLVPYSPDQVKDAPNVEDDEDLAEDDEPRLYAHYGLRYLGAYQGPDHPSVDPRWGPEPDVGHPGIERGRRRLRKCVLAEPLRTSRVAETVPARADDSSDSMDS